MDARYEYRTEGWPKLKAAMEATAPSVLFSGPWGSGKTRLLAEKAYFLASYYPDNIVLLLRKRLKYLKATTWNFLTRYVVPREYLSKYYYNRSDLVIRLPNGSEIWGGGIDDPGNWASTEFGFIGVDQAEQLTKDDEEMCSGRLRLPAVPFHQLFQVCNPAAPAHHLYQEYYLQGAKDAEGNLARQLIEGEVLWGLLPASYRARLMGLRGRYKARYIEGKWMAFEGLVYDCFKPAGEHSHMVDPHPIPDEWPRLVLVDFGYANPFCLQCWAQAPKGRWERYREIYLSHRTVMRHAETVKAFPDFNLLKERAQWICDHDAEDRATLEQALGIRTLAAKKDRRIGFQRAYELFAPPSSNGDEPEPEIVFHRDCLVERDFYLLDQGKPTCTEEEIQGYVWAGSGKDEAVKQDDHGMDLIRYLANELKEPRAKPSITWV
jgi:phage terminase large subunit